MSDSSNNASTKLEIGSKRKVSSKDTMADMNSVQHQVDSAVISIRRKQWIQPAKVRALGVDLVLDRVAKMLPVEDLLSRRADCKSWNHLFVNQMRRRHELENLVRAGAIVEFAMPGVMKHGLGLAKTIQWYTHMMRSSQEIPYFAYKIYNLHSGILTRTDFEDFFTVCGTTIHHLTLDCSWEMGEQVDVGRVREAIFQLTPQLKTLNLVFSAFCVVLKPTATTYLFTSPSYPPLPRPPPADQLPSLEVLFIKVENGSGGGMQPIHRQFVSDLISCAPKLNQLVVEECETGQIFVNMEILWTMDDFMPNLRNLKILSMPCLGVEELRLLASLGRKLQLQKLTVFIAPCVLDLQECVDSLYRLLYTQANSLLDICIGIERIYTSRTSRRNIVPLKIPYLQNLTSFHLKRTENMGPLILAQYDEGTLEANFPRLKTIGYTFIPMWSESDSDSDPEDPETRNNRRMDVLADEVKHMRHAGVTQLILDVMNTLSDDELNFGLFAEGLPSVRKLDLRVDSYIKRDMSTVWTAWPKLDSLCIRYLKMNVGHGGAGQLDVLLSGVPRKDHSLLQIKLQEIYNEDDSPATNSLELKRIQSLLAEFKKQPGLSDLKQLRELTVVLMKDLRDNNAPALTDIGGYFGLAMANADLQKMTIHGQEKRFNVDTNNDRTPNGWKNVELFTPMCREIIKSAFHPFASISFQSGLPFAKKTMYIRPL